MLQTGPVGSCQGVDKKEIGPMSAKPNVSLSSSVSARVVLMTPELARSLLAKNTNNRTIIKGQVKALANAMKAGQWRLTTDMIGVTSADVLMNGQHRLAAVIDSGVSCLMWLAEGLDPDGFAVTDQGKVRTMSDALRESKELVAVANFIVRFVWNCRDKIQVHDLRQVVDAIKPYWETLKTVPNFNGDKCQKSCRTQVVAAAMLAMLDADSGKRGITRDYVLGKMALWAGKDVGSRVMWQFMAWISSPTNRVLKDEVFLKAIPMFEPGCEDNEKLYARPRQKVAERFRETLPIPNIMLEIRHNVDPTTGNRIPMPSRGKS